SASAQPERPRSLRGGGRRRGGRSHRRLAGRPPRLARIVRPRENGGRGRPGGAPAGHIEGWRVDSHGWRVSYAVVKAAAGAARKHLLLPVSPLGPISWSGRAIHVELPREALISRTAYQ